MKKFQETGDIESRNLVLESVYPLVRLICSRAIRHNARLDLGDITDECIPIIIKVLEKFDFSRNCSLSTLISVAVKNRIGHVIAKQALVYKPYYAIKETGKTECGGLPDDDFLENERQPLYDIDELEKLNAAIVKLPPVQKGIIRAYYFKGKDIKEIAAKLGVSRQRVHQILGKAMESLREQLT